MNLSDQPITDSHYLPTFRELLERGQLFFEKCELQLSRKTFLQVIERANGFKGEAAAVPQMDGDITPREALIEAIAAMLRLAAEAKDEAAIARWDAELERHLPYATGRGLAMAWHNRGVVATHQGRHRESQTYYFRALRAFQKSHDISRIEEPENRGLLKFYAKLWASIAATYVDRGLCRRGQHLAFILYERFSKFDLAGPLTQLAILQCVVAERAGDFVTARKWVQEAHANVLADRNWFFHLYVLLSYARVERKSRNFAQAYWYLDLVSRAANLADFGALQSRVEDERRNLENDAVDLLIDSRQCEIRTREKKDLSLGKQYVLLGILEALTEAHYRDAPDSERGLSKGDIIERVWGEKYRPESHDNKLYYNINRLRKLIEPDMKHPKYLLNWKEGYRLAPGLKVHYIGGSAVTQRGNV